MARPLRIQYPGAFYHVTSRGNERKKIFLAQADYARFKTYLKEGLDRYGIILHCYVLMGNHYHLVLETPRANLSSFMQRLNSSYTTYFNLKRTRSGHLFQGRFKAILVDKDSYLLELSRYIHLNPVRANLVEYPEACGESSYRAYIGSASDRLVSRDLIWSMVTPDRHAAPKAYRRFVEKAHEESLPNPYAGLILGSTPFIKKTLIRIKDATAMKRDLAQQRRLSTSIDLSQILTIIASHFKVPDNEVRHNVTLRNLCIYLARTHTALTNGEIGEKIGLSYSGVAKAATRFAVLLKKGGKLKKDLDRIETRLSRFKV